MYPDFKELLSVLNEHRVEYLVVGAYAVSIHAQPRATKDLDILINPDTANARKVFAALAQFGAPLQDMTAADFAESGPFFRMGREPISVDILTDIPGVDFDAAWKRRVVDVVDPGSGLKASFISAAEPHCRQTGDRTAAGPRGRGRHPQGCTEPTGAAGKESLRGRTALGDKPPASFAEFKILATARDLPMGLMTLSCG
ncbi:MAG: hypothetical protein J0H14_07900 [Alphaproteobacteria bacterium]|nr:hypothetical protein [Alphaproteobacteria bacterium]